MYLIVTLLALAKSAPVTRTTQDDVSSSRLQICSFDHNIDTIGSCRSLQNIASNLQQKFNTHIPKQREIIHKENEDLVSDETEDSAKPTKDTERTTEDRERPKEDTERSKEKKERLKEYRVRPNEETKRLIEDKYIPNEDTERPIEDTERPIEDTEITIEDTERTIEVKEKPLKDRGKTKAVTEKPTENTDRTMEDRARRTEDTDRTMENRAGRMEDMVRTMEDRARRTEDIERTMEDRAGRMEYTDRKMEDRSGRMEDIERTKEDRSGQMEDIERTKEDRSGRMEDIERTKENRSGRIEDIERTKEDRSGRMEDIERTKEDRARRTEDTDRTMEDRAGRTEDMVRTMEDRARRMEDIERTKEDRAGGTEDTDRTMEDRAGRKEDTDRTMEDRAGRMEDTVRTMEDRAGRTEDTDRTMEDRAGQMEDIERTKEDRSGRMEDIERTKENRSGRIEDIERTKEDRSGRMEDIERTKEDRARRTEDTDRTMEDRAGRTEDMVRTMEDRARRMEDIERTKEDRAGGTEDTDRTMEDRAGRKEDTDRTMEDRAGRMEDTVRTMEDRAGRTEDTDRTMEDRAGRTEDIVRTMEDRARQTEDTDRKMEDRAGRTEDTDRTMEDRAGPKDDTTRRIKDTAVQSFVYVEELVETFYNIHMTQLSTCVLVDAQIRERMVTKCSSAEFVRSKFDFVYRQIKENSLYGASVFVSLTKEDIVHRCEKPQRIPFDPLQHTPVDRHNFYNIFCAVCNGFDIRNVLRWRTAMKCNIGRNASINKRLLDRDIFLSNKSFGEYITLNSCKPHTLHHSNSRICFEAFDSFPKVSNKHATTNNSGDLTKKLDEIWYAVCQKYTFVVAETTTGNLYKNPHCLIIANSDKLMTSALSDDAKNLFEMVLACYKNTCPWSSNKVSYKNLSYHSVNLNWLDFFEHSKTAPDQTTSCPEQHVFDVFYNTCVVPSCPEDMQFIDGKCSEPIPGMCNFTGNSIVCPRLNETDNQQLEYKLSHLPLIRTEHQIKLSFAFVNVFYEESIPRMFSIPLLEGSAFGFGDSVYGNNTYSLDNINLTAVWTKMLSKSNELERRRKLVTQLLEKTVFFAKATFQKISVIVHMGHRLCSNNSEVNKLLNNSWPIFDFIESDKEISYVCEDLKTAKNFTNGNTTRVNSCHLMKRESREKPDFDVDTCITMTFQQEEDEALFYQWLEYWLKKIIEKLSTVYFNSIIKYAFLSNKEQYVGGENPFPRSGTFDDLQEMDMTSNDRGCPEGQKIVVNEWSVVSINRSLYAIDDQLVRFPTGPFWYDLLLNTKNMLEFTKPDKVIVAWCVENTSVTNRFYWSSLLVIQMVLVAFV